MQSQYQSNMPDQFVNLYGLGSLQAIYPVGVSNRWVSAIVGVFMLVAGGLVAVYGLFDSSLQVAKYGPVMFSKTIIGPAIIAAFLVLFGILAAWNAFQNWKKSVAVYQSGLAYADNGGVQIWNWAEVEWLYTAITRHYRNGFYTGTTYTYTLQKSNGSKLRLDNKFKQIEALGRFINQKVAPFQYERLLQQIRNGQTAVLGQISISINGLTLNKKSYAWSDVENIGIKNGMITVKKKEGGMFSGVTVTVASTPNIDALFAVVDQFVKVKPG